MSIICIIPARGGSKGVPGKNIRDIAGKPLIVHSIEQAKNSARLDSIYVTTDDAEIAKVAEAYGASIINRPIELASDTATSESALLHALQEVESKGLVISLVVFLQCTSPIREPGAIDSAIDKLEQEQADSLLSVSPFHGFIWEEVNGEATSVNYDYNNRPRRQDARVQYIENGSIYVFKPEILKERNNRLGGKIAILVMNEEARIDIDSLIDFAVAEAILGQKGETR